MLNERVSLPKKLIVGVSIRTNNTDALQGEASRIAHTIRNFWGNAIPGRIENQKYPNETIIGYTDYESDEHGDYTFFIGKEVTQADKVPEELDLLVIPAGHYQKITTPKGEIPEIIRDAWEAIWHMSTEELGGKRLYHTDFQVHDQRAADPKNATVDIYVGVK
jgi:predicted transcriptional regulator YdeE